MDTLDFGNRTYTAEVIETGDAVGAMDAIQRLTDRAGRSAAAAGTLAADAALTHGFVASQVPYHRVIRRGFDKAGGELSLPRQKTVKGKELFLYDAIVARRGRLLLLAVPFHGLAEDFFVSVDKVLAGTRLLYHRLNITSIVVQLAARTARAKPSDDAGDSPTIGITRCQLAYSDPEGSNRGLHSVRLAGDDLGRSKVYKELIQPVLNSRASLAPVFPVVLGFSISLSGVKRASAVTDMHGNFKIWVGHEVSRLTRVFELLTLVEGIQDAVRPTSNIPILQSRTIRDVEVE